MTATEFARLAGGRRIGKGKWIAKCAAHPDRKPSLSIAEGKTGVLVKCMSHGCDTRAVLDAMGLRYGDLFYGERTKRDPAFVSDAAKLDGLMRKHTLMLWLASLEPHRRHYWHAAMRRVAEEMEPLYWRVLPDKEHLDDMRRWESESYRKRRMDWLSERQNSSVLWDGK